MSDDEFRWQGPMPSPEWVTEHARRIRELAITAEAHETEREAAETAGMLADIVGIAERQIEAFAVLPCRGELDRISACSNEFSCECERRQSPSCPRRIRRFDFERVREELRRRLIEADMQSEDIAKVLDRDLIQDDADSVMRMLGSGVQVDAVLSVVCSFKVTKGTAAVDRFLADQQASTLVLAGDVGVGKSVAAGYAIRRQRGRFIACSQLEELSRFGDDSETKKRAAFSTPLLVIDDVGTERDWVLPTVQSLLVERHNERRRTVLTTNMNLRDFAKRYGERVADRVSGSGMFVPLIGPSLRRRTP